MVNKVATLALVYAGAMCLFTSLQFVQENWWSIEPCKGIICQAVDGFETSRISQIMDVKLRDCNYNRWKLLIC